jgi:hypothetical protein
LLALCLADCGSRAAAIELRRTSLSATHAGLQGRLGTTTSLAISSARASRNFARGERALEALKTNSALLISGG